MIRTVLFDMGNVLVSYAPAETVRQICPDSREDQQTILREVCRSADWIRVDRGDLKEEDALEVFGVVTYVIKSVY